MNRDDKLPVSDPIYAEAFHRILDRIHHEDTLIDRRYNWLLTSQAIFLAAYEIVLKLGPDESSKQSLEQGSILLLIPPLAGCRRGCQAMAMEW